MGRNAIDAQSSHSPMLMLIEEGILDLLRFLVDILVICHIDIGDPQR